MSGATKALEAELYGENLHQNSKFSVEAGRDVMTDLRPWQQQALGMTERFAIQQSFKRRHPLRTLNDFTAILSNNENPRTKWEDAYEREAKRAHIPEAYAKLKDEMIVNQIGLVETALKNFTKSQQRFRLSSPVGV